MEQGNLHIPKTKKKKKNFESACRNDDRIVKLFFFYNDIKISRSCALVLVGSAPVLSVF